MSVNPGLSIKVNINSDFANSFSEFPKQVDYAISTALNATAVDAQKAIREHIHSDFIVRRQAWVDRSIKITKFATKSDLSAVVAVSPPGGESRDVLSKFEDGGTKVSAKGGDVAVPSADTFPNDRQVIPQSKRPLNLRGSFKIQGKNGKSYLFTTVGRGKNRVFKMAYCLEKSVHIPKKLDFVATATQAVADNWNNEFNTAWQRALDTAQ